MHCHLQINAPIMALAAYTCSSFLFAAITRARYASTSFAPKCTIKSVKIHFSTWFRIVPQANKSVVHASYKRVYNLAPQADFRTYLQVFCRNRSTVLRNGRPFHAGHLAEKLI